MGRFHHKQFQLNEQTIARFAGLMPTSEEFFLTEAKPEIEFACDECHAEVPLSQLDRNAGVCDKCARGK